MTAATPDLRYPPEIGRGTGVMSDLPQPPPHVPGRELRPCHVGGTGWFLDGQEVYVRQPGDTVGAGVARRHCCREHACPAGPIVPMISRPSAVGPAGRTPPGRKRPYCPGGPVYWRMYVDSALVPAS